MFYAHSALSAIRAAAILSLMLALTNVHSLVGQQLAFPTADGYGKYTTGGRGGAVYEVTNLNDDGLPGSLRYAINRSGPRTIVFRVSGTIALKSLLKITNGDLTIAGQTAPGDGICLRDYKLGISASNIIIRHMRFRLGDAKVWGEDAFGGTSPKNSAGSGSLPMKNIMIDHCSVSYGSDETLSIYDIENLTVQWCIISESLNKDGHGFGGIMGGWGASLHHTLFAHHKSRSPRFCGARYQFNLERELVDMRYNVIYNAGNSYGGEGGRQNVVNNYYKRGTSNFCNPTQPNPSTTDDEFVTCVYDSIKSYWYVDGNYVYGNPTQTADNWNGGVKLNYPQLNIRLFSPLPSAYLGQHETAEEAFVRVCNDAGANKPRRDSVDMRVVQEVINNTGKVPLTMADIPGDAFPTLNSLPAPADDDQDGMPNDWELAHGLNPNSAADRNTIGQDGYTMLEVYLNGLTGELITGAHDKRESYIPDRFDLRQNYPNPFNPSTTITYELPRTGWVRVGVYDVLGKEIVVLVNTVQPPGTYQTRFSSEGLAGGIYYCRMLAEDFTASQKLVLIK